MSKRSTRVRSAVVATCLFALAAPAPAEDSLSDSIETFLQDVQERVDQAKIWKFQLRPRVKESLIWTDNLFLNERGEDNLRLTQVSNSGGLNITDPNKLKFIESQVPEFQEDSRGRVDDFIWQQEGSVDLELPLNPNYIKAFEQDTMKVLTARARNQRYFSEHELNNTSVFLNSDIFAFVSDLMDFEHANAWWVRSRTEWNRITDPLDANIRLLRQDSLNLTDELSEFERDEFLYEASLGYNGNYTDWSGGWEYFTLKLDDDQLQQADHRRKRIWSEAGAQIPGMQEKRLFARIDYWTYDFGTAPVPKLSGATTNQQILNDADVIRWAVGVDGFLFSRKMQGRLELGHVRWDANDNGLSADDSDYSGFSGALTLAYKPWADKNTTFQFSYERNLDFSTISNYNAIHTATASLLHEVIEKRLDTDFSVSYTNTFPSDGPRTNLWEAGVGATYHFTKQLDFFCRYLIRWQESRNEIVTPSAFQVNDATRADDGNFYNFLIHSDGDFYQNVFELGFELKF